MAIGDGMVGQEKGREAAGRVASLVKKGNLGGRSVLLAAFRTHGWPKTISAASTSRPIGVLTAKILLSVDGVFVLKLPEYKGNPPRLAIELNPTDSSGNPTKKRGLMTFDMRELETFRELIGEEGLDDLMETIMEVNPEKGKKKRPEEEEEDVIEI